jgi:phosphoribosylaminoimidazole carboxylase PurE protein
MADFRESVEKGLGAVVILAGSGSDRAHVKTLSGEIAKYGLPVQARVASAHKQPNTLGSIIEQYDSYKGPLVYIAVAGGTDALSGTVSWETNRPVITCPPDAPNESCLRNPPGSSNAYVARAANAARFAAQIFSYINPACVNALEADRAKKIAGLQNDDSLFSQGYFDEPVKEKK